MSGVRIFTLQKDNIWVMLMHDAVYVKTMDVIHYRSFCLDFEGTDNHYMQPGVCPRVLSLPSSKEGVQPSPFPATRCQEPVCPHGCPCLSSIHLRHKSNKLLLSMLGYQ